MGRDVNRVFIQGRVKRPIELRECPDGKPVADFVLVSNRRQLSKDDPDRPKFAVSVKVTVWNEDALYWSGERMIEPLEKGDEVMVEGQLFSDDFEPKGTGQKTSGRLRIDNANIKLMKRARRDSDSE
jgi:single-stranded DNA-binding protein